MLDCNSQMLDLSAVNTMPEVTLLTIDNTKPMMFCILIIMNFHQIL